MAAAGIFFHGIFVLAITVVVWAISVWWYGRVIDAR
jgi:hypothetical protein